MSAQDFCHSLKKLMLTYGFKSVNVTAIIIGGNANCSLCFVPCVIKH